MNSIRRRLINALAYRAFNTSSYQREKVTMGDPLEHATGLEKRELLAKLEGNTNPFNYMVIKREKSSKECPNKVPSAFKSRLIGCICEEESTCVTWMWLHDGEPKRCECGYWFAIERVNPV